MMTTDIITPDQFEDVPRTDAEFRRRIWHKVLKIEAQTTITNGRVSELEKFRWLVMGGLSVLALIVVPIFLKVIVP